MRVAVPACLRLPALHMSEVPPSQLPPYPAAAPLLLPVGVQPGTAGGLGSVAEHIAANCRRPTAIVRPQAHGQ